MNSEKYHSPSSDTTDQWGTLQEVPFAGEPTPSNIPSTSPNRTCAAFLRGIEKFNRRMDDVKSFITESQDRDYKSFTSETELTNFSDQYGAEISHTLNNHEKATLKRYSGYSYDMINQVARGQWNYHTLDERTPEKLADAEETITKLSQAINSAPNPESDFATYRGTNLDSFLGYDVHSLSDLDKLEGQFFLESGFTSSALDPNKSFVDYDFDDPLRKPCDIKMKICIPKEATEIVGLLSEDTCYNEQKEILIDKSSLFFINSVQHDPEKSRAELEMLLIPRDIYDPLPPTIDTN